MLYPKKVNECQDCPGVIYYHSDGEGESSSLSFYMAFCGEMNNKPLSRELMAIESRSPNYINEEIPRRKIPVWYPFGKAND